MCKNIKYIRNQYHIFYLWIKGSNNFHNNRQTEKPNPSKPKSSTGSLCYLFLPLFHFFSSCPPCFTTFQSSNIKLLRQWIMLHRTSNIRVRLDFAEFANCQAFPILHKIFRSSLFLNMQKNAPTDSLASKEAKQYHTLARVLLFWTIKFVQRN